MIVTEEQAKEKWCPFARVLLPVHQVGNRISTFHMEVARKSDPRDFEHYQRQVADCNCIGSRCMAWRFTSRFGGEGYCGLAGMPAVLNATTSGHST